MTSLLSPVLSLWVATPRIVAGQYQVTWPRVWRPSIINASYFQPNIISD